MIYVTQLVYVHEGQEKTFQDFEDVVLPLLAKYRGDLILRLRPESGAFVAGSAELPYEVHIVRFESDDDLAQYTSDPERQRALSLREQSIRSSILIKGTLA